MESSERASSVHMRPNSDSDKRLKDKLDPYLKSSHRFKMDVEEDGANELNRRKSFNFVMQKSSLQQEIQQFEKCLKNQFSERQALEKALGRSNFTTDSTTDSQMPKPTKELIREIAMLELDVMYLEQYSLSLYRRAFEQVQSPSPAIKDMKRQLQISHSERSREAVILDASSRKFSTEVQSCHFDFPQKSTMSVVNDAYTGLHQEKPGYQVHRSHSSLIYLPVCLARVSHSATQPPQILEKCHTEPLCFHEHEGNSRTEIISLADHLGTTIADHIPETPNRLSEDMVSCMGAIYCKFADHVASHQAFSSSPTPSSSSMSSFSPRYMRHLWSPSYRRDSSSSTHFLNPYVEESKEIGAPYNSTIQVTSICKANRRCSNIEDMLHKYKLLVNRLIFVDPRKMNAEEKLAFWINIHNAMMMHAHIENGIPQSNMKRTSLLSKNMYDIGGRTVNASTIQGSILRFRMHPPGQWLRILLSPRAKIKDCSEWQGYAIKHPEPLLHFALCSGSHSDPAVRVYNPKRLFHQLEAAKVEYIRARVSIWKEHKILLPKIVESFAKDSKFSQQDMLDMIKNCLPQTLGSILDQCQATRPRKLIEWVPHNFAFRYLLSSELSSSHQMR